MTKTLMRIAIPVVVLASVVISAGGCASRGRALRPTVNGSTGADPKPNKANAYYIESKAKASEKPFSCSFVEFDERGDYLNFAQHRHAYETIRRLGTNGERLLVIMYVHGWKNNSQSSDVLRFNNFLSQVSEAPFVRENNFRVHGVFLGWRGNSYKHSLDVKGEAFRHTTEVFEEPIVNRKYSRGWLLSPIVWPLEQLSYWRRKGAAEEKVSGIPIVRTIFACGHTARRYGQTNAPNRVFLLGHSFGALMLEQSFAPATLTALTAEWPWDDPEAIKSAKANPLPIDLTMLVNSAAPSIYAKQFYGYMTAHRDALAGDGVTGADAPLVISLTSTADKATRYLHSWGNLLAPLYPSLWRSYDGRDFILDMPSNAPSVKVPQYYYYRRTPGHNPLLVNHWITNAPSQAEANDGRTSFQQNLDPRRERDLKTRTFTTSETKNGTNRLSWQISTTPPDPSWSEYKGYKPIFLGAKAVRSGYWIMRCPKQIIRNHNDVWNQQAMDTYAALFRETEFLRTQPPGRLR